MSLLRRTLAGRSLNPIGLGCRPLSRAYLSRPTRKEAAALLHAAVDQGYEHFDTARHFGRGENEALLNDVLRTHRDRIFLASKCGIEFDPKQRRIDCRPETIRHAVEASLAKLGVDHIDLYSLHRGDIDTPIEESVGALARLKAEGKIGAIGLSEVPAQTIARAHREHRIDAVQCEYSLLSRQVEIEILDQCTQLDIAFIAASPLACGRLGGLAMENPTGDAVEYLRDEAGFGPVTAPLARSARLKFETIADLHSLTPSQLALAWLLSRGKNVHVIPGTTSIARSLENLETASFEFPRGLIEAIDRLMKPTLPVAPQAVQPSDPDITKLH